MEKYLKIKAFAQLTGVSVRTLQYYDEINLLKPAYTNKYGHRFYDSGSFSKMFVINSLKKMGMSLGDINQYINNNNFDIRTFIEEEMRRVEKAIMDLQLLLMQLSKLNEQIREKPEITYDILSIFSQILTEASISQAQIDSLLKDKDKKLDFNIKDWNTFINDLNFCFDNKLTVNDKKALKCIKYWKETILEANQISDDIIKLVEDSYRKKQQKNTFGFTYNTYKYLIRLLYEYDKL